jgi:hypothetical protein
MVGEIIDRLFGGEPAALASHLLADHDLDASELGRLRRMLDEADRGDGEA